MEGVVFLVFGGTTYLVANQRLKSKKRYDSQSNRYDGYFGKFVTAGNRNNLNSFIRRPNRETKLLVSPDSSLFGPSFQYKHNQMKLTAKTRNPKGLMNPIHTRAEHRTPMTVSRLHGYEEDKINYRKWMDSPNE